MWSRPAVCPIWVLWLPTSFHCLTHASAYCSILKLMMLSHHTPANAKYAELLDIAETLTSIFQSFVILSAEIDSSSFDLFRNCSQALLIYWLLLIKLCRWLTHSLSFCSHFYLPTWFCTSPSWYLMSFLVSGFFALLSCHPLSQVHQHPLFHLQWPASGLHLLMYFLHSHIVAIHSLLSNFLFWTILSWNVLLFWLIW